MPSLSDQIDRFTRNTKAITTVASSIDCSPGPFTRAILNAHLGDLIRDIDPAETGLFTLTFHEPAIGKEPELGRVDFVGATPLKKGIAKGKEKEPDPEVFVHAALKVIDRYQSVRSMRKAQSQAAAILDQLESLRANLRTMSEDLTQIESTQAPSLKAAVSSEEQRIKDLQSRMNQLRKRKENAVTVKKSSPHPPSIPVRPSTSADESILLGSPAAGGKTFRIEDDINLLTEERVDLGDVSTGDFVGGADEAEDEQEDQMNDDSAIEDDTVRLGDANVSTSEAEAGEDTVVIDTPTSPEAGSQPEAEDTPPTPTSAKKPRVKVNTEVERIVAKIWTCTGEVIKPGHNYDTNASAAGTAAPGKSKPPLAKETITYLQTISSHPIVPSSPAGSSIVSASSPRGGGSQKPTTQQILTAHLLLSLLTSEQHGLLLGKAKDVLAQKVGGSRAAVMAQGTNRILYHCVAKRLLKIDRGGGEQVVRFDV